MKRSYRPHRAADESPEGTPRRGAANKGAANKNPRAKRVRPTTLRVIGGDLRRRGVAYNGDLATRPMKDSVRENLFNILGKGFQGAVAYDLFAGTGILAIEAISRGARHAIAIDVSRDSARSIRGSVDALGVSDRVEVLLGDAFRLAPLRFDRSAGERRVVFCCPPYAMWTSHRDPLIKLLLTAAEGAAEGSLLVAEMDRKTDLELLPEGPWSPDGWDVRTYGNTHLAIAEVSALPGA